MNTQLLAVSGIIVLVIVMVDVAWTTLTTQGSGPITRLITVAVDLASAKVHALFGSRVVMVTAGPVAEERSRQPPDRTPFAVCLQAVGPLVYVLRELHDDLDRAVFEAYG